MSLFRKFLHRALKPQYRPISFVSSFISLSNRSKWHQSSHYVGAAGIISTILYFSSIARVDCENDQPNLHNNSKLTILHVETPLVEADWDDFMKGVEITHPNKPIYVLFLADIQPNHTQRWCRDCVIAEPIIFSVFEEYLPNAVIVTCSVSRTPYKTPGYTYATNPSIQLACVPTLMRWKGRIAVHDRLNDSQCQHKKVVINFLKAHDGE